MAEGNLQGDLPETVDSSFTDSMNGIDTSMFVTQYSTYDQQHKIKLFQRVKDVNCAWSAWPSIGRFVDQPC
jgi:hypothetical protein